MTRMSDSRYAPPETVLEETLEPHRRRWWIAALMSALCPGYGFLYLGKRRLAIGISAGWLLFWLLAMAVFSLLPDATIQFYFGIMAAQTVLWLLQIAYAVVSATRLRDYSLSYDNHLPTYVVYPFAYLAASIAVSVICSATLVEELRATDDFMAPAISKGDVVFVRRLGAGKLRYGDVIAYRRYYSAASDGHGIIFGRIVGFENDVIEAKDGEWQRNRKNIPTTYLETRTLGRSAVPVAIFKREDAGRSYLVLRDPENPALNETFGPTVVRDDHIYVANDRLEITDDSREYGAVRTKHVVGMVVPPRPAVPSSLE
ncbi:MAG: signal peptidase I [Myxococcota bacterium]